MVWLAVVLALAAAGTLGVWAGRFLSHVLNPEYLHVGAGVLFIGLGVWFLVSSKGG